MLRFPFFWFVEVSGSVCHDDAFGLPLFLGGTTSECHVFQYSSVHSGGYYVERATGGCYGALNAGFFTTMSLSGYGGDVQTIFPDYNRGFLCDADKEEDYCVLGNSHGFVSVVQGLSVASFQETVPARAVTFAMEIQLKNRGNAAITGRNLDDEVFVCLTEQNLPGANLKETVLIKFSNFSLSTLSY